MTLVSERIHVDRMVRAYNDGVLISDICDRFSISHKSIYRTLARTKRPTRVVQKKWTEAETALLLSCWKAGDEPWQIARRLGRTTPAIKSRLYRIATQQAAPNDTKGA